MFYSNLGVSIFAINVLCILIFRCSSCWPREAFYPEVASVLCPLWLCFRSTKRPEVEGGETSCFEWDGGVYHPQSECDHRANLPGSGPHGEWVQLNPHVPTRSYSQGSGILGQAEVFEPNIALPAKTFSSSEVCTCTLKNENRCGASWIPVIK